MDICFVTLMDLIGFMVGMHRSVEFGMKYVITVFPGERIVCKKHGLGKKK